MPSSLIFLLLLTAHIASPLNWTYRSRCYDHQTDTYRANDMFSIKTCSQSCTVTPFFSPDNALEAHMKLIDEAQESITIANPSKSKYESNIKSAILVYLLFAFTLSLSVLQHLRVGFQVAHTTMPNVARSAQAVTSHTTETMRASPYLLPFSMPLT